MKTIIKRLYIITHLEVLVLLVFVLWNPSEIASQFFLGRSLNRWLLAFPEIIFLAAGILLYMLVAGENRSVLNWAGRIRNFLEERREDWGSYLVVLNFLYLVAFALCYWVVSRRHLLGIFEWMLPWIALFGLFVYQVTYFMFLYAKNTGGKINLIASISSFPTFLRKILLDSRETSTQPTTLFYEKMYWFTTFILLSVFLLIGYFLLKFAGLNTDEGWYLYAARQVYHGQRPYQDFAFTQMPFLPYLYGLGLLIFPSVYTGRFISLAIYALCVCFLFLISGKFFNRESFIWILLLIVANSEAFYFNTIVKTYSLTLLFFILSLYLLFSDLRAEFKYPLTGLILLLGFLTRLTFIFYAFIFFIKALVEIWKLENKRKIYFLTIVANLPLLLFGFSLLLPNPQNVIWNIYTYNAGIHSFVLSGGMLQEYFSHLRGFINSMRTFWLMGVPLVLAIPVGLYYRRYAHRREQPLLIGLFAVFMFLSVHFLGGGPMYEYYVPAKMLLVALLVWYFFSFSDIKSGLTELMRWSARLSLSVVVILLIYTGKFGYYNYDYYHGHPPIETIRKIAYVVNQYYPGEPILTFEGLYVAIEAKRDVYPGLSMSQFSILDVSNEKAQEFHFVNRRMLQDLLEDPSTKILVLSESEVVYLGEVVPNDYVKIYEIGDFGQKSVMAYVFVRK